MANNEKETNLFAIATLQHGYFTTKQAIEAGFKDELHSYYVKRGNWIREIRGIYRLVMYPHTDEEQYALWSLWSMGRDGIPKGVFSLFTALSIYELGDFMPEKLNMTVPTGFRRLVQIPKVLSLNYGNLNNDDIEVRSGYSVTTPAKTIVDLVSGNLIEPDVALKIYNEAVSWGYIQRDSFNKYKTYPKIWQQLIKIISEVQS